RFADRVAQHFARVSVSLDASTGDLYEQVRGINALGAVARGVARLRALAPGLPITARSTLHRANYRELPRLIEYARRLGLDGLWFLPADVSSLAFGRDHLPDPSVLALDRRDIDVFAQTVEHTIAAYRDDFESGFVAESPDKLRRLPRYYAALAGDDEFPPVRCNAPWVSIVIDAKGQVRPCFFHEPIGSVREAPLAEIVATELRAFRESLDMERNATCTRCVCSLKTGWRHAPWRR